MAGRGTNVKVIGMEDIAARLEEMLRNTDDLAGVWKDIYHPALLKGEREFFDSEGEGKWRDLTSRYELYDSMHGGGGQMLTGTPRRKAFPRARFSLRDSLTNANDSYHIFDLNARWFRMGTRDPLANIFFAKKGRRKRKPMDAKSQAMQDALRLAVEEHSRRYAIEWGG